MAVENEEIENENEQQQNHEGEQQQQEVESNPLASTGSKDWDKLIDDVAGTGEKKDVNAGKSTQDTLTLKQPQDKQVDPNKQANDAANQQRQSNAQDQAPQSTRQA